jgi:AbrB family transcriptional regulator, transcriptional pleiotropic regulator of transition state genes
MLKATGIIRKVDNLGRLIIPKELRKTMDLPEKTPIEIFTEGDSIILRKYQPACIICGQAKGVTEFKGKRICKGCRDDIRGR